MPDLSGDYKKLFEDGATWTGWERNERGKLGPRLANMKSTIDPQW